MELRLSGELKRLFLRAASASGLNLSSYVIARLLPIAREDVAGERTIRLSARDRVLFLSLLRNPPGPNNKMVELMSGKHAESKGIRWSSASST